MQPLVPGRGVLGARPAWLMLCRRSPSTVQWQGFHDLSFSLTVLHAALGVCAVLGHPCLARGSLSRPVGGGSPAWESS